MLIGLIEKRVHQWRISVRKFGITGQFKIKGQVFATNPLVHQGGSSLRALLLRKVRILMKGKDPHTLQHAYYLQIPSFSLAILAPFTLAAIFFIATSRAKSGEPCLGLTSILFTIVNQATSGKSHQCLPEGAKTTIVSRS